MKYCYCLIIAIGVLFKIIQCNNKKLSNNNFLNKNFPEFKNISSQHLLLYNPTNICKCHQRTIFFRYPSFLEEDNMNENISEYTIENKEYFVGSAEKRRKTHFPICISDSLRYNEIIKLSKNIDDANIYIFYSGFGKPLYVNNIKKYQRNNRLLIYEQLYRKDLLYKNFYNMKKKYPNEFTYMAETYTFEDLNQFKELNKNYRRSENDLWLIKLKNGQGGKGIRFLRNTMDITNKDLVTRYISNPLLINGRKFDFRLYVLVTGNDPLKIYHFGESVVRLATEIYDLNLDNLDNKFKHLTNTHINSRNKKRKNKFVMSLNETKTYIEKNYNIKFSNIWNDINDIIIKTLISINHIEIEREKQYNLKSNNLYQLFGFDVIVDSNFKPWLLEVNGQPSLGIVEKSQKRLKYKLMIDIFNIIGMVPYSHINGLAMDGECEYENSVDEAVKQSICEFTRPMGGFVRIFPKKDNIEYYRQFFET
eukprot:jgi/Orpsp1_1/1191172/evm.model.d7180000083931.1